MKIFGVFAPQRVDENFTGVPFWSRCTAIEKNSEARISPPAMKYLGYGLARNNHNNTMQNMGI
jgi:hypothetical protein